MWWPRHHSFTAKAMLAPAINSTIKTIMALDAVASSMRPRPRAATPTTGPFISCLTRWSPDVELMIVYGAAIAHYGFGTPVRALPISRFLEMLRETVRRHMGRLVTLGLFERAKDQTFVPTNYGAEVVIPLSTTDEKSVAPEEQIRL